MTAASDPIAIVGMALRFPGDVADEASLWRALSCGVDLVTQVDSARWAVDELQHPNRAEPGRSVTFSAGVLSRIDEFDASFFGISPREAAWVDPQQRLLLELAWEAMENAGQVPSRMAGSDVAVYVGISSMDYGLGALDDLASMTAHSMTGNTLSIAANRLSYAFDLRGPSLAVDTACSSSLVALHHACNALRAGECSAALVGGVSLLLHPYPFIGFTKAHMLSANGRCRPFDADGDGYVRAEGGAVLFLKPLSAALADGDPVQAVILATGANADGSQKSGMTIPSSSGQAALMKSVLQRAGISPDEVAFIEAHGTGTPVGDPVEAAAIGEVYGSGRPEGKPLPIGSVKSNMGHLEPASGMAGLIKAVLGLKHRALAPSLHFEHPNPNIDFKGLNLEVVTQLHPLVTHEGNALIAGVNSFGFGGANAHVLLQEYRQPSPQIADGSLPFPPLFISARSGAALRELAARYADLLETASEPGEAYDVAHAAAFRRERFEKRLALQATDGREAAAWLRQFAQDGTACRVVAEDALAEPGEVAFIYSGNGAQWVGMGRKLLEQSHAFSESMTRLDVLIRPLAGFSILEELNAEQENVRLDDTAIAQPLLFAIQVAATQLLHGHGIRPKAVAGHSVGEVAAAWAAGALALDQAAKVICARSHAQAQTRGTGRMAAVNLSEATMRDRLASGAHDDIVIAGVNSPNNVTVSGSQEALERLGQALSPEGVFFRMLDLDYAFHSDRMDPIRGKLLNDLAGLEPRGNAEAMFISTVTGGVLRGEALNAEYWWRNVREPVHFAQAVSTLIEQGCRIFVEIGPHAILQRYIQESLTLAGVAGRTLDTLRRNDDGLRRLDESALRIHMLESAPALDAYFPRPGHPVQLPNYPWQRERFTRPHTSEGYALAARRRVHPLLGWRLKEADAAWENTIDPATLRWLGDHQVGGAIVLPGAAYVEMALAAAHEWFGGDYLEIEELDILAPIVFDEGHSRTMRFELSPRDGGFQIRSRERLSDDNWTLNAVGRLPSAPGERVGCELHAAIMRDGDHADTRIVSGEEHYRLATAIGLDYGDAFQGLGEAKVAGDVLQATLLPKADRSVLQTYHLHPALLDVCFQSLIDFFADEISTGHGVPLLPVKVGRLRFHGSAPAARFRTRLVRRGSRSVSADFELFDVAGRTVATLTGCRFRAAFLQRQGTAAPAIWENVPELAPHPIDQAVAVLPRGQELARHAAALLADGAVGVERSRYFNEALPLFEALSLAFAHEAFQRLFERDSSWLRHALAVAAAREGEDEGMPRPFLLWLVACLRREGLLVEQSGAWQLQPSGLPPSEEIWQTLLRDFPACLPKLVIAGRVGRNLPALLAGTMSSAGLLEGIRGTHVCDTLYDDAPAYLGTRFAVEAMLQMIAGDVPNNHRLRILEIGASAGEIPRRLAGMDIAGRLDYVLAVPEEVVRERLATEFQHHPYVTVAGCSGEELDLVGAHPVPAIYDVVIFRHSLHRALHPAAALVAAQRKLARGGLLIIAERHSDLHANFMAGLDPHWWRDTQSMEPVSWLMAPDAWAHALAQQEFSDVEIFEEPASEGRSQGAYLVLAKRAPVQGEQIEPAPAAWLLMVHAGSPLEKLANHLVQHLLSRGQKVVAAVAHPASSPDQLSYEPDDPAWVDTILRVARNRLGELDHVVYLPGIAEGGRDEDTFAEAGVCTGLLDLVQRLGSSDGVCAPRLWLLTSGGVLSSGMEGDYAADPAQAAIWGFGRVIMNEYPALSCTLIDVTGDHDSTALAQRVENELLYPDAESEIMLAPDARYGLRMRRTQPLAQMPEHQEAAPRVQLDFRVPGQLRNLLWLPTPERALNEEEVEVETVAAGLNFRDVMYSLGLLPDEAVENGFAGASLGLECSGVVTRVGSRVRDFSPGDAVMGFGPSCFSSHVITRAGALAHKPAEWSFDEAATVPTVFFTVYYALKHLANLQPGERILIHGAAGGVGIAAIQLASHMGAEIFATAGSDEKRDFVRLLGADHVFDSRSLDYAEEVLACTDGQGVDVVLNSLAGEAIRRNLRILRPFGRFLELGKRDFFENTPVGLRPFKDNISYFGIDADQLLVVRPELAERLFREVMTLFKEGVLTPLPYQVFPAERVVDAFRAMQQARHIGKIVVSMADARVQPAAVPAEMPRVCFDKDGTYLVTGGLSGFGGESARWLVEHGAGNLVLLGRRGMQTPGADALVLELQSRGAQVRVVACDVADRAALDRVIGDIRRELPPLRGVLHAAMALDDALIGNLDAERFAEVLAPKVLGAKYLHELTVDLPLDHFILYSSVTTYIGNPGQANYVAANAYLEGLANRRRAMGLPATCIGWGPIGDSGYLTRNKAVKDSLEARLGAAPMSSARALGMLDELTAMSQGNMAIADFNWHTVARLLPAAAGARFEPLRREAGKAAEVEAEGMDIASLIQGKSPEEVRELVQSLISGEIAVILGISADRIDASRPLTDLGMDSLMGVELALAVETRLGITLPTMVLNEGPTIARIAQRISERLLQGQNGEPATPAATLKASLGALAQQHGESLSDEELSQAARDIDEQVRTGARLNS